MQKGRPKGGKNKYWSVEEKYKIIKPILIMSYLLVKLQEERV